MILYFTGTGNSAYVAKKLADALEERTMDLLERIQTEDYSPIGSDKPWIIVCPTYAWQIPRILRDYLKNAKLEGSRDIFFVLTCGGSVGNAGKYAKRLSDEIGMNYKGLKPVVMPENYIAMFRAPYPDQTEIILENAEDQIAAVAQEIAAGEMAPEHINGADKLNSGLINSAFYSFAVKDKKFTVSDACTGCGTCVSLCPLGNITLQDGKPVWNGNCTHCMACICRCPAEAIEYGKNSVGQIRYTCPGVFDN